MAMRITVALPAAEARPALFVARKSDLWLASEPASAGDNLRSRHNGTQNMTTKRDMSNRNTKFGRILCRLMRGSLAAMLSHCCTYARFCSGLSARSYNSLSKSKRKLTPKLFRIMSATVSLCANCSAAPPANAAGTTHVRDTSPKYTKSFQTPVCFCSSKTVACNNRSILTRLKYMANNHKQSTLTTMCGKLTPTACFLQATSSASASNML
mmetsp:Transcript_68624/g.210377  ORF Transcript_68624/g.210377 Transcript_68624/m.210377 type:complete len:211 (-) Transcript_68624:415-1047(-)